MSVKWTSEQIGQRVALSGKKFMKALFFNCEITHLDHTTLDHCCLLNSKIIPRRMEDVVGVTVTLDCFSWKDVHLNELAFDLMLWLLSLTTGNDEKRAVLQRIIRSDHLKEFKEELAEQERLEKQIAT